MTSINFLSNCLTKGQSAGEKSNRVLITRLSRVNHLIQSRCMRYAALLLVLLIAGIGNVWGGEYAFINNSTGKYTNDFFTGRAESNLTSSALTIHGLSCSYYVQMNGTGSPGVPNTDRYIQYDVKSTSTTLTVYFYNNNSSTNRSIKVGEFKEGKETGETVREKSITKKTADTLIYSTTNTKNSTIYITVPSNQGDILFYQVIANETGSALPRAGEGGYELSFNKGRFTTTSSTTAKIDGITIYNLGSGHTAGSTTSIALPKRVGGYIKFTTPASPGKLKVTYSTGTLAHNSSASADGATAITSATEYVLSGNTEYYLINTSSSGATITKLEFVTPSCPTPTATRGGTEATPAGGVALGTVLEPLTCTATGTSVTYQWKQNTVGSKDGAVNAVGTGATTSSFVPNPAAADSYWYYCVVTDACSNTVETSLSGMFQFNESCTAPNHVDISGRWDRFAGETISLTATAYSSAGTGSPIADGNITGWQWEKLIGSTWTALSNGTVDGVTTSGATTKNLQIANCGAGNSGKYRCIVSTGATCSTPSATATDGSQGHGVKVYVLECYNDGTKTCSFTRTGDSQAGTATLTLAANTAYTFKFHVDNTYYGNNASINTDITNYVFCNSDNGGTCASNFTVNSGLGGTFTFAVEYSTGGNSSVEGEPELSVTYPRKTIYLAPNSDWLSNSAKFAYYYFHKNGDETDAEGWTGFLTSTDCGRYADIPQWNGVKMIAVRFNSTKTSTGNWDDKWNQTDDITVTANDLITITGWNNSQTYGTYSIPTYTISYNAGTGGSGSKANETKTCGVDFTLPSSAVFTRTGYTQTGWTTSDGAAQTHALGGSYTTNAAQTFYPVWTVNQYSVTHTLSNVTKSSGATGANAATYGTNYTAVFAASSGYALPESITVSIGGSTKTQGTEYTWNQGTGTVTITGSYITGDIVITITGESDDPCSEPAEVTNEIARFFVPCGLSNATSGSPTAWNVTNRDASTGDNTFSTYKFGGGSSNWYRNATSGLIYGKLTANDAYIQIKLKSGNFHVGDVVTAYFNRNDATKTGLTLKTQGSSYAITPGSTAAEVETSGTYTLVADAIEADGSIKLFRAESNSYINRIIVTRTPCSNPVINEGTTRTSFAGGTWAMNSGHNITITATGADSYEWYRNTSPTDAGATKLAATGNTIDVTDVPAAGTYYYKAVAKSGACSSSTEWGWCGAMTITAPVTYSVTYNANRQSEDDGDGAPEIDVAGGSVPAAENYTAGQTVTVADNTGNLTFTLDGAVATFRGWTTSPTGYSNPYYTAGQTFSMPTANLNLYAVWSFPIEYHTNGGTINDSPSDTYYIYTNNIDDSGVKTATLPTDVTKSGYTFGGWYHSEGLTGARVYDIEGYWYGTYHAYAKWIEDTGNKVTYNGNGNTSGSVPTDDTDYAVGDIVTVKGNTGSLVKTGQTFLGWSTSATASSGTFYPADYKFAMPAGAVTLYAVWGTGQVCYTITDFETTTHNSSSGNPDGQGKYFYGYMGTTDTEHAVTITAPNTSNIGMNSGANMQVYMGNSVYIYADNTTTGGTPATFSGVTAISLKIKNKHATKSSNFTIKVGSTTVANSVSLSGANNSTYTTYTYDGLSSLSGKIEIHNGGSGSSDYNFFVDDIEICTGSGSSGYTVTFDNNGEGEYSRTITNVPSGSKIGVPIPAPTADGNTFGGWYKENTCTNAWNFATETITSDKTLYAKWTSCLPVITTQPVGNTYTQGTAASPLTVTATGDVTGYQWFSNDENNATTGTPIDGQTTGGCPIETSVIGTTYYYCVVSNACGSTASNVVAIEVNDGKETPCAAWTIDEPTHGGQGFSFSVVAKRHDCSTLWDGTLTAAMLTASDGVVLGAVTVNNTTKTISGTYGVTGSAESPVTFYLSLPATATQTAATLSQTQTFTACAGGAEEFYWSANVSSPLTANTAAKLVSKTTDTEIELSGSTSANSSTRSTDTATGIVDGTTYSFQGTDPHHTYIKMGSGNTFHFTTTATATISIQFSTPSSENSGIEIRQSSSSGTVVASKMITSKAGQFQTLTASSVAAGTYYVVAVNKEMNIGEILVVQGSGSAGTITPTLAWSNSDAIAGMVEKNEDAADFSITATRSDANALASLGTISYSSSNTSVATVNAATGQVTIADGIDFGGADYKTTTITATLSSSGCYKAATITYVLQVNKYVCTEAAGTVSIKTDNGCAGQVLTVTDFETGATGFQWYKNGDIITGATNQDYTATVSGTYSVVTTKTCDVTSSNSVKVTIETATATKIVDEWYVKKDRRTPDIALVQTTKATGFTVSPTDIGGCTFYLGEDGIIYLHGQKDNGEAPAHDDGTWTTGNVTVTITATACRNAEPVSITIHKQAETLKPSIAFVVDGGDGEAVDNVTAAKTSSRDIWTHLSTDFTLTGCNIYWTTDEKALRQYYSQYDAILITDDPNTQKIPGGKDEKKSVTQGYVNAMGTLIDVRPLLTMEAYVSRLDNWDCVKGTPQSPNPREYVLKLQCKEHTIYKTIDENGTTVRHEMVDGIDNWYITMVDASNKTYADTDDETDATGTPALQGFDGKVNAGMLGIGTIANEKLQGGIERQAEPAARMMVLGINNKAMAALTEPGKQVITNALHYLLLTDMESLEDCSNYFHGNEGTSTDWFTAANWSAGKVPDPTVRAIILAPCVISGQTARASSVDIAVGGTTGRYKSGTTECEGNISISANGALVLNEGVSRIEDAPNFGVLNRKPTRTSDLAILSESTGNGTLILNNEEGNTQATVAYYSKASTDEADIWNWQYMAVPFNDNSSAYRNYYDSYLYRWAENCSGWEVVPNRGAVYPWVGYTITQVGTKTYYMDGTLVETGEQTFTVPAGADLVLGNSWTAPLQVKQFEDDDFDGLQKKVYLFNTGYDYDKNGTQYEDGATHYEAGTYVVVPIHSSPYTGDSLISSLQAFTVTSDGSEGTLTLDYERHVRPARSTDKVNAGAMHAPSRMMAQDDKPEVLKIWASGQRFDDRLVVLEREDFSTGYDEGWDGEKVLMGEAAPTVYTVMENGYESVTATNDYEGTLIGFKAGEDSEYTFRFDYDDNAEAIYLLDMDVRMYVRILSGITYTFTCPDKGEHNRFLLTRKAPGISTGYEPIDGSGGIKATKFIKDNKLYILLNGTLYDATGKIVVR